MDELPSSTVVIATRNRPELLLATVESILDGSVRPDEIVVVDQSTHPQPFTSQLTGAGNTAIHQLRVPPAGLSAARNVGLRAATGEIVAVTDDDMLAATHWLESLLRALSRAGADVVVTGRVDAGVAEVPGAFAPAAHAFEGVQRFRGRLPIDVLAGGNMALYRSTLGRIGLFDERLGAGSKYPAAEDNDFGFRVLAAGLEIEYVPDAILLHRAWRTSSEYFSLRWRYGLGKGGFYAKHLRADGGGLASRAATDVWRRVRRFPRLAVSHPRQAAADAFYVAGVAVGLARWLSTYGRRPRASFS